MTPETTSYGYLLLVSVVTAIITFHVLDVLDALKEWLNAKAVKLDAETIFIKSDPTYNHDIDDEFEEVNSLTEENTNVLRDQNDLLERAINSIDNITDGLKELIANDKKTNSSIPTLDNQADGCKFHAASDTEVVDATSPISTSEGRSRSTSSST
jgi:hypothetical protein